MADKFVLPPLYLARARCENEHNVTVDEDQTDPKTKKTKKVTVQRIQYLARLWIVWRVKDAKVFHLSFTDSRGYWQPCGDDGTPDATQTQSVTVDKPHEFYFVRHPAQAVAKKICDAINAGSKEFGPPTVLTLKKSQTGVDKDGNSIDEALLLVPESPEQFWPRGHALYEKWLLFRDMPNAACPPIVKQVGRLQLHLGAMRFLVGDSHHPYRPDTKVLGTFDIMAWNSVIVFQEYLGRGFMRVLLDGGDINGAFQTRTRLYESTFPFEPSAGADFKLECKESVLYAEKQTLLEPYPSVAIDSDDRGVVSELTGEHLSKWLEKDGRKPDKIVVCWNPPAVDWVHEELATQVAQWSADLENHGFPPPNNAGHRASGVTLANGFRDIRVYTKTGGGAVDTSLHKIGAAFDLWMGAKIGSSQNDPSLPNYYPLHYTRNTANGPFEVWGEVLLSDIKNQSEAVAKGIIRDTVHAIEAIDYDPTSPTGGAKTIHADIATRRFFNISASANLFGIFNIPPHGKGWQGDIAFTYSLGRPPALLAPAEKGFADLMVRLEQQMFKENIKETDTFTVNGSAKLSGDLMRKEYGFLKAWNDAFGSRFPFPNVRFTSMTKTEINRLRTIAAGYYPKRRFIIDGKKEQIIDVSWVPPGPDVEISPMFLDPATSKHSAYTTFQCPEFKGKPNHLEWWHFQVRKIGTKELNFSTGATWFSLVSELGISRDIVEELYDPDALTKKAV